MVFGNRTDYLGGGFQLPPIFLLLTFFDIQAGTPACRFPASQSSSDWLFLFPAAVFVLFSAFCTQNGRASIRKS